MNCPICNSTKNQLFYELYDDRYGYDGVFNLYECVNCKHKFIDHRFSSNELGDLYSNYYPRSNMKVEDYSPLKYEKNFKSWLNGEERSAFSYVPKNVRVLDIGCGFGQSLGYHRNRGCEVYGVEADENIRRVADKFGFNVKVGLFDPADYELNFFDYVTMDQVIEHVTNPIDVLKGINSILKSDAICVLSTPSSNGWGAKVFGKRWINWHTPYHLQHFSRQSVELIAKEAGFEIESIKTVTSSEWLYYQWIHVFTFPKAGEKSIFWGSDSQGKSIFKKIILKLLSIIHKTKINHILTRLFDGMGMGDNYIIILRKIK